MLIIVGDTKVSDFCCVEIAPRRCLTLSANAVPLILVDKFSQSNHKVRQADKDREGHAHFRQHRVSLSKVQERRASPLKSGGPNLVTNHRAVRVSHNCYTDGS